MTRGRHSRCLVDCLLAGCAFAFVAATNAAEWQQGPGYRSRAVEVPREGHVGFKQLPGSMTGVFFTNHLSKASAATNRVLENGSGVALGDVDGDGWCDVYLCGMEGDNVLYRNLGGWRFEAMNAGVSCPNQFSTGAVFADTDGDADLDLLVGSIGGGVRLFANDGKGRFTESKESGLAKGLGATSMALADIDADNDLDLYIATYRATNYKDAPPGVKPEVRKAGDKYIVTPDDRFIIVSSRRAEGVTVFERGEPDFLYRNDGQGRFTPVPWTNGDFLDEDGKPLAHPPYDWGLSVMFRDMNGDGAPDIYVCNDFLFSRDTVWINDGKGRFKAIDKLALRNMSMSSMGIDFADINRDGFDDFFVVDMLSRDPQARQRQRANLMKGEGIFPVDDPRYRPEIVRNTLHLNRGDGSYAEIANVAGLEATEWSWCPVFIDVDLDGYEDLLLTTGNLHDVIDADTLRKLPKGENTPQKRYQDLLTFPGLETPNLAFRNQRDLTFKDMSAPWGFNAHGISQGMALADLDNDGDLDVVVNNMNAAAGIYRNEATAPRIAIRLKGIAPNGAGTGAKVNVFGGPVDQTQEFLCGGRYLSHDDAVRVFAAGMVTNELAIEVTWRSGKKSTVRGAKPNRVYEIHEASATPAIQSAARTNAAPLFEDVSHLIGHTHQEPIYDDFKRQPLLGERLSEAGPAIAWHDLNRDGWDDLLIGCSKGGHLAVYRGDQKGGFAAALEAPFTNAVARDLTAILSWSPSESTVTVLAGLSNAEEGPTTNPAVRIYNLQNRTTQDALGRQLASVGPIALGDMDGDGHMECFVGARLFPGRYPEPVSSRLYQNVGGQLRLHTEGTRALERVGLVTAAVFADLGGAGYPDLVLACDWGAIRVFRRAGGVLKELTHELGFAKHLGRWNSVTTGDIDGDGRLDLIAGNWGRNTKYQRYINRTLRMVYADFLGDGGMQIIETFYDKQHDKWFPWRDFETMAAVFPPVAAKFGTFRAYGGASIEEMFGEILPAAREARVTTLDSMIFFNRTNGFEALPLPSEAQFAPAFGLAVSDFDGDGNEDIFMAQNFFATEPETPRYDAGRGLLLRGDGTGALTPMPGQASGIKIYGEQRGCATADYDRDGRVDMAVGQNGGETKLYRNVGAQPGLRVRLNGPPANPYAVGAVLRPIYGNRLGPAREIHAGSGYWSQDSAVPVFALKSGSTALTEISVRWPGGKTTTAAAPPGNKELTLSPFGDVKSLPRH